MRAVYFLHVATGLILVGLLVAFFDLRNESSGRSGVIESVAVSDDPLGGMLPESVVRAPLDLVDRLSQRTSDRDFEGRYVLLFFGYTHCPDVCPDNLTTMKRALDDLGEESRRVQPLFVSIDPERDTRERLATYVAHFDPELIGLTGTRAELQAATRAFGVFVEFAGTEGEGSREIRHSSDTYLIGPDGAVRVIFRHGMPPEEMAAGIRAEWARDRAAAAPALP